MHVYDFHFQASFSFSYHLTVNQLYYSSHLCSLLPHTVEIFKVLVGIIRRGLPRELEVVRGLGTTSEQVLIFIKSGALFMHRLRRLRRERCFILTSGCREVRCHALILLAGSRARRKFYQDPSGHSGYMACFQRIICHTLNSDLVPSF